MRKFLSLLLIFLCLCGCAVTEEVPVPPEEPEIIAEEPEPVPAEPLPEIIPGMAAMADGKLLEGGTVYINDTPYLKLEALLHAIGATYTDPFFFRWKWLAVSMMPDSTRVVFQRQHKVHQLSAPLLELDGTAYAPLELCSLLGMSLLEDEQQQLLYITSENGDLPIPEGYTVPTLMYHGVTDNMWGFTSLFLSPADMEAHLKYLTENGYTTIHFSDLAYVDQIEKPVLLTFDDGYIDNYEELFPLLQKYNCKATVFVVAGSLDINPHFMTWEQAKEMADSGLVSIQSHTVSHPELSMLTAEAQAEELIRSKEAILQHLGREPYVISYPSGRYTVDTLNIAREHYDFGMKMNGNIYITGHDPMEVNRWFVPRGLNFGTFVDMVQ